MHRLRAYSAQVASALRGKGTSSDHYMTTELVLERYLLARTLGTGGFGTVWAARDERLQRDVAVKVLQRARVDFARFEREARAAARLSHPAIVMLYEAAVDEHRAYLVSELVRGKTLRAQLDAGRCSDRDILEISLSVCEALAHAHAQGVIHRDVKPSNILVPARPASAGARAKLTDFGVARVLDDDTLTATGDVVGTAAYMAPEQLLGREADAGTDLYALALVVYEALCGVNPAAARRRARVGATGGAAAARPRPLPPLRRQRRALSPALGAAVDRALAPDPRARGTLQELALALTEALAHAGEHPGVITGSDWLGRAARAPDEALADPGPEWLDAPGELAGPQAGETRTHPRRLRPAGAASAPPAAALSGWPARALGSLSAALTTWWLCTHLLVQPPLAPPAAALLAAGATLAAPRLGTLLGGLALAVIAITQGMPGGALLALIVLALTVAAMPRQGGSWTLPCGAVLLGSVSLAGAWPALCGRSGKRLWQRAALGAAGFVWCSAAAAFTGTTLYAPVRPAYPPAAAWEGSLEITLHDVVLVMLHADVPAGAAVWALAAALAPLIVRGRSRVLDGAVAVLWAAATLLGVEQTMALGSGGAPAGAPRGALAGLVLGAAVVVAPWLLRYGQLRRRAHLAGPRVS